jgi:hypothetical protein
VFYDTAGFNYFGWQGGCDFATASCASLEAAAEDPGTDPYTCDASAPSAAKECTANHLAIGRCMRDTQNTYDGCTRVIEFSNGGCAAPEATTPSATTQISGWYRGPGSRCIEESANFGRNGYHYTNSVPIGECYRMECVESLLHIVIDGVHIPCPQDTYIRLDDYPGARRWLA